MAQKRKRSKKWISWIILAILLIAAGVVVFLVWDNYFNDKKEEKQEEQGVEQVERKEAEKTETAEKEKDEAEKAVEEKKVNQYDGNDPNKAEELSGVVTYAGVSGGNLVIRVNIDQYLESGECNLALARGGSVIYNSTANVVGNASTATCEGFDVPVSSIGSGVVEISISVKSGERSGTIRGEANI